MSLHLAHILRMLQVQLVNLENEASHERKYELQVGHLKRCLQRHLKNMEKTRSSRLTVIIAKAVYIPLCCSLGNLGNLSFTLKTVLSNSLLSFKGGWQNIPFAKQVQFSRSFSMRMGSGGLCCVVLF